VASDGSSVPSIQFSSFDPSKDSLLVSPSTYEAIKNAASVSGVTHDQPAAVDASALGVATDGFVVNREQYINWIDAVKKQDPKFEMNNALDKAVEIKIPQSKFFDK
jgi:ADP-ribosylglycohydrolase